MAPMRRLRSPLTTRQTAAKRSRSALNSAEHGRFGMERGERVGDAVLLEVVADAHLAAEAVAAPGDGHLAGVVRGGLDQHGHVEVGQAQGLGDAALLAEVGQGDDDAVDLRRRGAEEVRALAGFGAGFHGAVLGVLRRRADHAIAGSGERGDHFLAAALGQVIREEAAIADDDSEGELYFP